MVGNTSRARRTIGTELAIPLGKKPIRKLDVSRGRCSWASISALRWLSKPCIWVARSASTRPMHSSGSKVPVRTCRLPAITERSGPSTYPKMWKRGR